MCSLKRCSKCQIEKSSEEFAKASNRPDGLQYWCKPCSNEASRINRLNNLDKRREYDRDYCKRNRKKKSRKFREWRHKNPEKALVTIRKHAQASRQWAIENHDHVLELQRDWRKANPEKVAANDGIRRTRVKDATPKWLTKEQKREIRNIYKSAKTSSTFHEVPFHVDHIEPLKGVNKEGEWVSCGLHVGWNLVAIPGTDNMKKSNKLIT